MPQVSDAHTIGTVIRRVRKDQGLTQPDLALMANVGIRFIVDLENGKESCQLGLSLRVLQSLGIGVDLQFTGPETAAGPEDLTVDFEDTGGFEP